LPSVKRGHLAAGIQERSNLSQTRAPDPHDPTLTRYRIRPDVTVFSDTLPVRREFHSVAGIGREGSPDRFEPGTWNASRGLYRWVDSNVTEHHSLAPASRCMRGGVVCLLSALQFHGLTTQLPHEVWLAIDRRRGGPTRRRVVPMRLFRFSGACFSSGVERHRIEGVTVRVYSVAKTITDCFKYRNKVGLDVAMEALREGWRDRRFKMDELWHFAEVCRVARA